MVAVRSRVAVIQSLQREGGGPSSLGLLPLPISLPFLVFCSFSICNRSAAHYSLHLTVRRPWGMKFPIIGDSPAERASRSSSLLPAPKTGRASSTCDLVGVVPPLLLLSLSPGLCCARPLPASLHSAPPRFAALGPTSLRCAPLRFRSLPSGLCCWPGGLAFGSCLLCVDWSHL